MSGRRLWLAAVLSANESALRQLARERQLERVHEWSNNLILAARVSIDIEAAAERPVQERAVPDDFPSADPIERRGGTGPSGDSTPR